jgi:hypothetical protein
MLLLLYYGKETLAQRRDESEMLPAPLLYMRDKRGRGPQRIIETESRIYP